MQIIFFGSDPWMSAPVLEALIKGGHRIELVITKGEALSKLQVTSYKLQVIQAETAEDINRENLIRRLLARRGVSLSERPDAIVLAAFGPPFLLENVLDWPEYGCLNVHASLLPRWRGASPVFAAIKNGDKETGVTIMRMTAEVDRGPILGQKKIGILQPGITRSDLAGRGQTFPELDDRETLTKKLGIIGGELIVETLKKLENEQIKFRDQPIKSPTPYTRRLTKEDGRIDWNKSPAETCPERSRRIERLIRAAHPWPSAISSAKFKAQNSKRQIIKNIKILKAHIESGKLVVSTVQLPGKNPVSWKQFIAGHPQAELR